MGLNDLGGGVRPGGLRNLSSIEFSAIPDSGDLHARYDATELSLSDGNAVSTWTDETGNGYDLTAGTAPTYQTSVINGNPVVRFDGVDDFLDVAFSTLSQPNHIFAVIKFNSTPSNNIYDSVSGDRNTLFINNGDFALFAGSVLNGSTADQNPHISAALFNGANSVHRLDGVDDATGDAGSQGLGGLKVGVSRSGNAFGPVDVGEMLVYPQDKSTIQSDVESYLSNKWGITI